MALTYATLQTQIAGFLLRDDLTAQIPTFILMAEAALNRDLRHWRQEKSVDEAVTTSFVDLPSDWQAFKRVSIGSRKLDVVSHEYLMQRREVSNDEAGDPRFYSLSAGRIELQPAPSGSETLTMIYRASIPELSDTTTTNWVLEHHPDLYIYGALLHSAPYLQEDERVNVWGSLYATALSQANAQSARNSVSGSGLAIR